MNIYQAPTLHPSVVYFRGELCWINDKYSQYSIWELIVLSLRTLAAAAADFAKGIRKSLYVPRTVHDDPSAQNTDNSSHPMERSNNTNNFQHYACFLLL